MLLAERTLDALGDPTRRLIFKRLKDGNKSVEEIARGLSVSRPAVSQHLKVLKTAGLAVVRVEGTRRIYAVDTRGLTALRGWLDGFWNKTLMAFKDLAEKEAARERETR